MPPRTAVWAASRTGPVRVSSTPSSLRARAGDDLERVSRLAFIGVRKDFLDEIALYGGERAYQEFVVKRQLWHFGMDPNYVLAQWISWIALVRRQSAAILF